MRFLRNLSTDGKITLAVFIIGIIFILFLVSWHPVGAHTCGCDYATPTPTQEAVPTPTETVVTPTPESNNVPSGNTSSSGGGGNTTPALPPATIVCTIPFTAPILTQFQANGKGSVIFSWMESETNIQKFSMVYGYDLQSLIYGIDNIPGSPTGPGVVRSITINELQPNRNVWDVVTAWQNGCPENSLPLDPLVNMY